MTVPINLATKKYTAVSLSEMNASSLMNRVDTKFIMHRHFLPQLLDNLSCSYNLLEINGVREMRYETVYFDDQSYSMFKDHHNQKGQRFKIRKRHYLANDMAFLEIKKKVNTGRTEKTRIHLNEIFKTITSDESKFIEEYTPYEKEELTPLIHSDFTRLSAVSKSGKERLTIDYDLEFTDAKSKKIIALENLVIIELKQEKVDRSSPCFRSIKKSQGRETAISKYCVGISLLEIEHKKNRFLPLLRLIQKIENQNLT